MNNVENYINPAFRSDTNILFSECEKSGTCLCQGRGGKAPYNSSCLGFGDSDETIILKSKEQREQREKEEAANLEWFIGRL